MAAEMSRGIGKNGESGRPSGPQTVPMRSMTGSTPVLCRTWGVIASTDFLNARIEFGRVAGTSGRSSCQRRPGVPM
jgi:hypothetical protein